MIRIAMTVLAMLLAGSACAAAAAPPAKGGSAPPTQDAIVKTFEGGDYPAVLQQLARVLPLRGKAAAGYDRYELLMLKGETHLRLKQYKTAADAFGAAAKETKDEVQAATARATQRLVREAKGPQIQRQVPRKDEPLQTADVLDPDKRTDALRILYDDLSAAAEPKVKEATRARTMPPIEEALTLLLELHDFELAAPGGDAAAKHADARDDLGERAQKLIAKELDRMEKDVVAIHESASEVIQERVRSSVTPSRYSRTQTLSGDSGYGDNSTVDIIHRGLSKQDQRDLQAMIDTSGKIASTLQALTRIDAGDLDDADELAARSRKLHSDARRVLNTPYRGSGSVRPVRQR